MANAEFLIFDKQEQLGRIAAKRETLLAFLASEGYSTADLLGQALRLSRTAVFKTLKAMERDGLVKLDYVSYAPGQRGKQTIWGLTPTGALMAADPEAQDFRVDYYESGRVAPSTVAHHLAIQRARLRAADAGWSRWESERGCYQRAQREKGRWPKVPDALTWTPEGRAVAVEVERHIKTPKRYDAVLNDYALMMHDRTIDEVHYLCNPGMAPRLRRLFDNIATIRVKGQLMPVPDAVRRRLKFFDFDQWPPVAAGDAASAIPAAAVNTDPVREAMPA